MNTKGSRQHSPTPPKQKWQNICLALCILLGILASCETEESFYQPRFPGKRCPVDPASVIQAGKLLCLHRLYPKSRDFRTTQSGRRKAFHRFFPVEIRHSSLELHL